MEAVKDLEVLLDYLRRAALTLDEARVCPRTFTADGLIAVAVETARAEGVTLDSDDLVVVVKHQGRIPFLAREAGGRLRYVAEVNRG